MSPRHLLSVGLIVVLVGAVWLAVSAGDDPAPATITTTAATTTKLAATTTTVAPTSTTAATTTTSTAAVTSTTSDSETSVEEAEAIIEDLYYRWFDAIYRSDEEAVREVIATEVALNDFRGAVTTMELPSPPTPELIDMTDVEVLRDDPTCLVIYSVLDTREWRGSEAVSDGVDVLLWDDGRWQFGTAWGNKGDLWQQDCMIEPEL